MEFVTPIILAIVAIVVIATIFSPSFQEKMFGDDSNETLIAGIFTVRGVSFVSVTLGLIFVVVYFELQKSHSINIDSIHFMPFDSNNEKDVEVTELV